MLLRRALLGAFFLLTACAQRPQAPSDTRLDEAQVRALFARMETAWNSGDFRGYMAGFQNPGVVFISNGRIQADWQATLDHYVRDYGGAPERRGTLHFYDINIEFLAPDAAMLIGHYHLQKPEHPQEGVNTRLMRKINGQWVIAMNHVSSFDP